MSMFEMKQKVTFDKEVLPHLRISGDITDGELSVFLTRGRTMWSHAMIFKRADIEALLPVFKELLELS